MHLCDTKDYPLVTIALFCFAIVESSRYGVSLCKTEGWSESLIGRIFGHLRWNTFLICYPIGATCDCLCAVFSIGVVGKSNPMMYSFSLPNALNFSFNFYYFLHVMPIVYIAIFPGIYKYLLA